MQAYSGERHTLIKRAPSWIQIQKRFERRKGVLASWSQTKTGVRGGREGKEKYLLPSRARFLSQHGANLLDLELILMTREHTDNCNADLKKTTYMLVHHRTPASLKCDSPMFVHTHGQTLI